MKNYLNLIATLIFCHLIFGGYAQVTNSCKNIIFSTVADNTGLNQCVNEYFSGFPLRQSNAGRIPTAVPPFEKTINLPSNLRFSARNGRIESLHSVTSNSVATKTIDPTTTKLSMTITFNDIRVSYDYEVASIVLSNAGRVDVLYRSLVINVVLAIQSNSIAIETFEVAATGNVAEHFSHSHYSPVHDLVFNTLSVTFIGIFDSGNITPTLRSIFQNDVIEVSGIN